MPIFGQSPSAVLVGNFGYTTASEGSFVYQTVIDNLNQQEPVLIGAYTDVVTFLGWELWGVNGHEWVCDGYLNASYTFCINGQQYGTNYQLLSMNWGVG